MMETSARVGLIRRYKQIVERMNVLSVEEKTKEKNESGANYASPEMAGLIAERARVGIALADNVVGVSYTGNSGR